MRPLALVAIAVASACDFRLAGEVPHGDGPTGTPGDGAMTDARPDAPTDAAEPVAHLVQQAQGYIASGSPVSATFGAAPAADDVLILVGAAEHGGIATVTGGGATWSRAARSLQNSNIEIWYGASDGSSSTVTITFSGTNPYPMWLVITEWAGLATTSTLDAATASNGASSPASAGTIATSNAADLVVFGASDMAPNTWGAPGPGTWSGLPTVTSTVITQAAWYRFESATGSFAPQVGETAHAWDAAIAAFRTAP